MPHAMLLYIMGQCRTTPIWAILAASAMLSFGQRANGLPVADNQNKAIQIESLRGISGFHVIVPPVSPDLESTELTTDRIITDVELQLRKNGIKVYNEAELANIPGSPVLNVWIRGIRSGSTFAISIAVEVIQDVALTRNAQQTRAATWRLSTAGLSTAKEVGLIRSDVIDFIDKLSNHYLSVNDSLKRGEKR